MLYPQSLSPELIDVYRRNGTGVKALTTRLPKPNVVTHVLADLISVVRGFRNHRRRSLGDCSLDFTLPLIPNLRLPLSAVEIGGVISDLLVRDV